MREEESSWFARWEELLSPEELIPLTQSLITPDLALAFDIRIPNHHLNGNSEQIQPPQHTPPPPPPLPSSQANSSAEFGADSVDLGLGGSGDEPARTLKRPRLVWTPQLHKRFVDAVAHLGIKNAVPKTIMQLMSVDGLTRENVASHLQKYRLYLRRMQGLSGGGGGNGSGGAGSDPAMDRLFDSSPVPAHFLHQTRSLSGSDHFIPPFVPLTTLQQQHQMAAVAAAATNQQHLQPPQYHHRQMSQLGSPTNGQFNLPTNSQFGSSINGQFRSPYNGQIEHSFLARTQPQQPHPPAGYMEDFGSVNADSSRKVLTLFPTRDD